MPDNTEDIFRKQRSEAFDSVIGMIDSRIMAVSPSIILSFDDMSHDSTSRSAEREAWSLFLNAIRHIKNGAPGNQPGSMTEALSKASLRSGAFAAALGIKAPQFEQMYFSVNYTSGHEAAVFFCMRLVEAAEADLPKSRQVILQRMMTENPESVPGCADGKNDAAAMKRQMAYSFNVLAETYWRVCQDFKLMLSNT